MDIQQIFRLLLGVTLFLFGMKLMGDGLKSVAGNKLEVFLFKLSNTTLKGVLLGTGVTAIIQSSCATSVMAVGFVNSGMMKLKQAVSVILGAILGTSITGWIICLSYIEGAKGLASLLSTTTLTAIVAVGGIVLYSFMKKQKSNRIGAILMGFAVLMVGMSSMSAAVGTLGETPFFRETLSSLNNPLLGILVGAVATAVLQSASAAVGIVQALSVTGAMTLGAALPLLMGVSIGASAPVLLSALGANVNGRRTALSYPVVSVLGTAIFCAIFYPLNAVFGFSFVSGAASPFGVAAVNTLLRLTMAVFLFPLLGPIQRLLCALIKKKGEEEEEDEGPVLEERFLQHPALAVEQSRDAIRAMAGHAREALSTAFGLLEDYSEEGFRKVSLLEARGDRYEDKLGTYLIHLTGRALPAELNREVSMFLHTLTDLERLTDHALNIAESAKEIKEKDVRFSDDAVRELRTTASAVLRITDDALSAFTGNNDVLALRVEPLEEWIDELCDEMKNRHVSRLQTGECTIEQGFVFNDLLTNFERVSDHCSNIAIAVIELQTDEYDAHAYLDRVKNRRTEDFERHFEEYKKQYAI